MTEILPAKAPRPMAVLGWDGTRFRVFAVDVEGHLQADVLSAPLPDGAALAAHQLTQITALQSIQNLVGALSAVGVDQLRVDVISNVLASGAATAANQATMITALQLIDNLVGALGSVNTDDLQVDVKTSALPSGAATAANQATMITALQLIDDLQSTLVSVGTDRIQVRGEDQLHSFTDTLQVYVTGDLTENDGYLESAPVGLGDVWAITNIILENEDRNITSSRWCRFSAAVVYCFACVTRAVPAAERTCWHGWEWAKYGDTIRGSFVGGQIGDTCHMWITGHRMLKATEIGPPPPGPQDLTTYIEVDPQEELTVTATTITAVDLDTAWDAYVYKDFGADYFDALNIDFDMFIWNTSVEDGGAYVSLANVIDDYLGFGATAVSANIIEGSADAKYIFLKRGADVASDGYEAVGNTWYYCTLSRTAGADSVALKIYSDIGRTTLLDTLTLSGFGTAKWRYFYAIVNRNVGSTGKAFDGVIANHAIG